MNPYMIQPHTEVIYRGRPGCIVDTQDDGWRYIVKVADTTCTDVPGHELTVVPKVGLGVTMRYFSDRVPGTIIAVSPSGRKVTIREDHAIRTDGNGMSDQQTYRFERNPLGRVHVFHRQGNGAYAISGVGLDIGYRSAYYDYSY